MALSFGGGTSGAAGGGGHKNMVEFRAGKMNLKGNTCTPDKRKGLVYIYHSEDGLTHFCWKDRKTQTVEDDLIIFPDDCEFKKVTQCKAGSRVYLLKFKASARKLFFWIQEPAKKKTSTASTPDDSKDSKTEEAITETDTIDEDILWKVNSALNNPQQLLAEQSRESKRSSSSKSAGNSKSAALNNFLSGSGAPSEADMQALLSNMSQSQLLQLIGGMNDMGGPAALLQQLTGGSSGGSSEETTPVSSENNSRHRTRHPPSSNSTATAQPSSTTVPAASSSDDSVKIQLSDLQKILSNMGGGNQENSSVDLSYGVNSDLIKRLIAGSSSEALSKIAQLLPQFNAEIDTKKENISSTSGKTPTAIRSEIEETLSSPQFTSALGSFCAAFPSGQLGPLISQFNMGPEAVTAAQSGDFEGFLSSIQKEVELKDNQQAVDSLSAPAAPPQNGNQKGNNSVMEVDENSTSATATTEQGKAQKSNQQETPKKEKGKAEKNENNDKDDMHTD